LVACGTAKSLPVTNAAVPGAAVKPDVKFPITFKFTGGPQSFSVPKGVRRLHIIAWGAAGGGGSPGGYEDAWIPVRSGELLGIFVGGKGSEGKGCRGGDGGYNGGAHGGYTHTYCNGTPGWGGGGASDVRDGGAGAGLDKRLIVAGGGGGQTEANGGTHWEGGFGGGAVGGDGGAYYDEFKGKGGTQIAGGAAGTKACAGNGTFAAKPGVLGAGGTGGAGCTYFKLWGGGGGGGGYYGGGGGTGNNNDTTGTRPYSGAGGGGSGFLVADAIRVNAQAAAEPNRGDGIVVIEAGH
jgi:hypothetical protein